MRTGAFRDLTVDSSFEGQRLITTRERKTDKVVEKELYEVIIE